MVKISYAHAESQTQPSCETNTDKEITTFGPIDSNIPLKKFFAAALRENEAYYAARQGTHPFTSPLFRLVQCLKAHPLLSACSAAEAFALLNSELHPSWEKLFPAVPLVSLEFVTAWEQANIPAGSSALLIASQKAIDQPLILHNSPICEGYEKYLAIAFHLQKLTPRRDILLPVAVMSGALSQLLDKSVSEQSVSYYSRLAQKDGYIKLKAKAHHPSGKAAQYQFDLTRFSDNRVEFDPTSDKAAFDCSHGTHGVHGKNGIHGVHGNEVSSSSCVLQHALDKQEKHKNENQQGENKGDNINTENKMMLEKDSPSTILAFVKTKKKKKVKRQSVVAVWQAFMCCKSGWQEKLPNDDYKTLVKFGQRTDEFAPLIVTWTMTNWDTFASAAVGPDAEYPPEPNVAFFHAYEAVAFNLWRNADLNSEEQAALIKACETSNKNFEELVWIYTLGEHTLFQNITEQLKYQGLLLKLPKGWQVCGETFQYITQIDDKYCKDENFRHMLLEAAGIKTGQSCE
jgi:hypothetical protein